MSTGNVELSPQAKAIFADHMAKAQALNEEVMKFVTHVAAALGVDPAKYNFDPNLAAFVPVAAAEPPGPPPVG